MSLQGGQCIARPPAHQPMETAAGLARPRPQLPRRGQGGMHGSSKGEVEDLGEVLDSLKTTDFVRKYSRKGRGSASSSPVGSMSGSGPSSPQGGMASPPHASRAATLTRMTSLRAKLERAQAATEQDRLMAVMGIDPTRTPGKWKPRVVIDPNRTQQDDLDSPSVAEANSNEESPGPDQEQDVAGEQNEQSSESPEGSIDVRNRTFSGDSEAGTEGEGLLSDSAQDDEHTNQERQTERLSPDKKVSEQKLWVVGKEFLPMAQSDIMPGEKAGMQPKDLAIVTEVSEPQKLHFTGMISRERVMVTTRAPATALGDKPSGPTEEGDPALQTKQLPDAQSIMTRHIPAIDAQCIGSKSPPPEDGSQSFSIELEDEGVGATDLASSRYHVAYSSVVLGAWIDKELARQGQSLGEDSEQGDKLKAEDFSADSSTRRLLKPSDSSQGSSQLNKPTGGGRFLTHPPLRERSVTKETQGSVDSNGLCSLREGGREVASPAGDLSAEPSVVSLDSNISPSDTQEGPSYGDVLQEVTSDLGDLGKKRNGKLPKFKSKSDPSSEKHKVKVHLGTCSKGKEGVGVQHAFISDHSRVKFLKEKSKSEDGLLSSGSKHKKGEKVKSITGHSTPDLPKQSGKAALKSSLAAQARQYSIEEEREDEGEDKEERSSPKPFVSRLEIRRDPVAKLMRPSTAPSTPVQSPDSSSRRYVASAGQAATLPLPSRHSPKERENRILDSQNLDVPGRRSRSPSPRPTLPDSLSLVGHSELLSSSGRGSYQSLSRSASNLVEAGAITPEDSMVKRDHIVQELVGTERHYVETLHMLVERYMVPLKAQGFMDSGLVDDVFYRVNEIYMHHATFLAFLERALRSWTQGSTVGDIIYKNFSKETVIENYVSFIEHFPRAEKVLDALSTKSSFTRFIEQCERETKNKLPLKAHIVKPAQRIPRYELLLKRLVDHTPLDHPDWAPLKQAEAAMHHLAMRINSVKEAKRDEDLLGTLKRLELLMFTELVSPDRLYLRYDLIHIMGRKDQCCVWLFSDLLVLTSIKRKSGPVSRKATLLLLSPSGQDFVENTKHKVWLKVGLDDVAISQVEVEETVQELPALDSLEADFKLLTQIGDLASTLTCPHQGLEEGVTDLLGTVNRQLSQHQLKPPPSPHNRLDLVATTSEGPTRVTLVFPSEDKRATWETVFAEARAQLAKALSDRPPDFLQSVQITKTRAGMQFSCAAACDHTPGGTGPEVWVCNSDGYVGHVCLLSLVPEPIVSLNTPVPGCSSRITAICHVTAMEGSDEQTDNAENEAEREREAWESAEEELDSDDTQSDHSSEDAQSPSMQASPGEVTGVLQDPRQKTMWLGTEDGRLHVFPSTDNIKTTRQRMRLHHHAAVQAIVHLHHKVFVALANGELFVYQRSAGGSWNIEHPQVVSLGSGVSPVVRMTAVGDRLWCSCQSNILVLNPDTLQLHHQFSLSHEVAPRGVACIVSAGPGVWVAPQGSSTLLFYQSDTYQQLLELSIAPAVASKLQMADDIIRQHKTACLRVTSLLACRDLLWVGTSAGIILTLPQPRPPSSKPPTEPLPTPTVTGLMQGHTGHVRFLTCVELAADSGAPTWMANRTLVISGGDGCEDFRGQAASEVAGREDSTNHLLLWKV